MKDFRTKCIKSNEFFVEIERRDALGELPIDVQKLKEEFEIKVETFEICPPEVPEVKEEILEQEEIEDDKTEKEIKLKKTPKIEKNDEKSDDSMDEPDPSIEFPDVRVCPICSKVFTKKYYFEIHKKAHGIGQFECHYCGQKFHRKHFIVSHILAHHTEKDFGRKGDFACDLCPNRYLNEFRLIRHKKIHAIELRPCPICAKMVKNMTSHMKMHATNAERFQCDKCAKNYKLKKDLVAHVVVHENKQFPCNVCGKIFKRPFNLQQHMRIHNPNRPTFPCHHCNHHYKTRSALLDHLRGNEEEKKFVCGVCSFPFRKKRGLEKHMHTHNGTFPYNCTLCDFGAKRKVKYLEHRKMVHQMNE